MIKKLYTLSALLILLSMILSACGSPAAAPVATEVQVVEPQAPPPTEVPPTPEPTEEPLDFMAIFKAVIADLPADKGYGSVKASTLNEELATQAPFLLDTREPAELEKNGYIEGAVHIPVRDVLKNLDKLPGLDEDIVIYCASGHRGAIAQAALKALGYTKVRNLGGGLGAWTKAELPVVTGSMPEAPAALSTPIVENAALFTALDEFISALPADKGFYSIKTDALAEALTGATPPVLVDVRSAKELETDGTIEGSLHIPFDVALDSLDQLPDKDAFIVIYCGSGHRGAIVLAAMRLMGYSNVVNLNGGLGAWKAANLPVVGGALNWSDLWSTFLSALPADQGYYSTKPDVLNTALVDNPPFLLDVREAGELEKDGYIAGTVHIPVRDVLKNLDKLPAFDQAIVIYCGSGHRGAFITAALRMLGWSNVVNLNGGISAWKKAEFPVEMGLPEAPEAGSAPEVDAKKLADLDAWVSALPDGFNAVKAPDLNTEIVSGAELVIIDVRSAEEFAEGYIEGAVNIPINDFLADMSVLPAKDAKIIVLCKSGHRGGFALMALSMLGYTDVRNLNGGMNAWVAAELPVVK